MREMKDSGIEWIGDIPADWEMIPIKYLASYNDETLAENTAPDFEFDYIEIGSVEYGKGITAKEHMKFSQAPSRARRIVRANDIIVSTVRTYLRAVAPITSYEDEQIVPTGFVVIRPKNIVSSFLRYAILSENFICTVEANSTGISYPAINASQVVQIKIPVPSTNEQQRIADCLDRKCAEIDAVIERTKATIEEYRKLRQAIVTDAVTKGVRGERALKDTGVEWIRIVPVDWEMVRGKGLFVETNTRSTTGEEELLTVSQYTGVTPRSQKNVNMFEAESLEGYKICKVGDIAANTMWLWAGAIGVSEYEGVISPSYNLYRQSGENYNPKYLDYLLRCTPLVQCYESMSTGIRASRLRLYPQQFLSIRFPVPPMAEQVEIVAYLDKKCAEMDALIARKTALLEEMESYKKSVIYEYVTGKKEVV